MTFNYLDGTQEHRLTPTRTNHWFVSDANSTLDPLDAEEWKCPLCGKKFTRTFLSPEEVEREFGPAPGLQVVAGGRDARLSHLGSHEKKLRVNERRRAQRRAR